MNTRELRTDRAKLVEDARAILKASTVSAEDQAKATRMLDDADKLKEKIDLEERAEAAEAETRIVKPIQQVDPSATGESLEARQKEAFRQYLVNGRVSPSHRGLLRTFNQQTMAPEFRDMNGDTGADGGYLIPINMSNEIEVALKFYGPMVTKLRNVSTDSGAPLQWPLSDDVANYSQEMTVGTAVSESDVPLGQVTFNSSTFTTGIVKVSKSLIQDAAFDVDSFVRDAFGIRYARGLNKATTLGSTSGNVQGLVGAAYVGATSAAPTAIGYLDLVALYGALDPAYVANGTWVFNNTVLRSLIGLEDNYGRPLFVASITSGIPDQILGKPFILNQDMVNPASATVSVLFGDLSKYVLRNIGGGLEVLVLKELYAPAYQIGMVAFHRHSGKLLDAGTHPVMSLQQHA